MSRMIDIWELSIVVGGLLFCIVLSIDSGVNGVDTQDADPSYV